LALDCVGQSGSLRFASPIAVTVGYGSIALLHRCDAGWHGMPPAFGFRFIHRAPSRAQNGASGRTARGSQKGKGRRVCVQRPRPEGPARCVRRAHQLI